MIILKNDRQCEYTKKKLHEFEQALKKVQKKYAENKAKLILFSHGYVEHVAQLKHQIAEYEKMKKVPLPRSLRARDPHEISHQLVRLRIARGLTQAQLAARTGCKQADISRLEQEDYQGYTVSLLKKVAATLDADVELSFLPSESGKGKIVVKPV
jgi:DNA-binding Xre family transcriptional regulator